MKLTAIKALAEILKNDSMSFAYSGDFDDSYTMNIIELNEKHVEKSENIRRLTKRINFLLGESFQNIVRHGIKELKFEINSSKSGCFMSRNIGDSFFINSANATPIQAKSTLTTTLSHLNELTEAEVKQHYFKAMGSATLSEKGGAGLGLIEMARKSKNELDFDFDPIDDETDLFYIKINLTKSDKKYSLNEFKDYRKIMLEEKLLMTYKGDFSTPSIQPLITVLQGNLKDLSPDMGKMKKAFTIFVEMIQNISKHGIQQHSETAGLIAIGFDNNQFSFASQNEISLENKDRLQQIFSKIENKDPAEIKKLYREAILHSDENDSISTGIGIINVARFSGNNIKYSFETTANHTINYTLKVTV